MKKAKSEANDWLQPEYKRSDLGPIVRGKYARRIKVVSNVVVIDPAVTKAFPNEDAVNQALRGLLSLAKSSVRAEPRPARQSVKPVRTKTARAG